jgi:hypothetical protein
MVVRAGQEGSEMALNDVVVMQREPYANVEDLLAPETLGVLAQAAIHSARRLPLTGGHAASGSGLEAIETNGGDGPRFVLKRVSPQWDWIMRATDDRMGREALAWTSGLLDRLPPEAAHPIIACARDGAGWAILMRDVSGALFPPHDPYTGLPMTAAEDARILDALAAMHASFWDDAETASPAQGFCTPEARYRAFSPETGRCEATGSDFYPRIIREGWDLLPSLVDPGIADLVAGLADDPTPLTAALARYPQTVVHGDPRPPNLGLHHNDTGVPRVVLLDWQFVGPGAPAVDLAWYLYTSGPGRPHAPNAVIGCYRQCLARRLGPRFSDDWWRPQLELSLLGQMLRCAQDMAWAAVRHESASVRQWASAELTWWSNQAKAGSRWLQGGDRHASRATCLP